MKRTKDATSEPLVSLHQKGNKKSELSGTDRINCCPSEME